MMSVLKIRAMSNQSFSSLCFSALAVGERTPSQFEKGPRAMISRLRESARERILVAARNWFDGVGPPGREEARERRSSKKISMAGRPAVAAAENFGGRSWTQARWRLLDDEMWR